jgi:hypothetical protein
MDFFTFIGRSTKYFFDDYVISDPSGKSALIRGLRASKYFRPLVNQGKLDEVEIHELALEKLKDLTKLLTPAMLAFMSIGPNWINLNFVREANPFVRSMVEAAYANGAEEGLTKLRYMNPFRDARNLKEHRLNPKDFPPAGYNNDRFYKIFNNLTPVMRKLISIAPNFATEDFIATAKRAELHAIEKAYENGRSKGLEELIKIGPGMNVLIHELKIDSGKDYLIEKGIIKENKNDKSQRPSTWLKPRDVILILPVYRAYIEEIYEKLGKEELLEYAINGEVFGSREAFGQTYLLSEEDIAERKRIQNLAKPLPKSSLRSSAGSEADKSIGTKQTFRAQLILEDDPNPARPIVIVRKGFKEKYVEMMQPKAPKLNRLKIKKEFERFQEEYAERLRLKALKQIKPQAKNKLER